MPLYGVKLPEMQEVLAEQGGADPQTWKTGTFYTVSKANLDLGKNILLLENPQFLPNHNETLPK